MKHPRQKVDRFSYVAARTAERSAGRFVSGRFAVQPPAPAPAPPDAEYAGRKTLVKATRAPKIKQPFFAPGQTAREGSE